MSDQNVVDFLKHRAARTNGASPSASAVRDAEIRDDSDVTTRCAAVYAAGQALAAVQVRRRLGAVTIVPDANSVGSVELSFAKYLVLSRRYLLDSIFVLMAGEGAERAFFKASDATFALSSTHGRQIAMELLRTRMVRDTCARIDPSEHDAIIAAQLQRAIKWAQRAPVWVAIDCVASALVERTTLDCAAVREAAGW